MGKDRWGLRLDPRTKLVVLVLVNLALTIAVRPGYAHVLVAAAVLLAAACGRLRTALVAAVAYVLVAGAQVLGERYLPPAAQLFVVTFFQIIGKVFPAGITGAVIIQTTRVNEFVAALTRWHVPRVLVTPFAVVFRYFPAIISNKKSSRLTFTEEERNIPELQKYIKKSDQAADRLDEARDKIPKKKVLSFDREFDEKTGKGKTRLHFEEKEKPIGTGKGIDPISPH